MLHDSHISSTDSDVARDAVPETVSMDSAIVEPPDAEFPDVWGEGTNNPWQNWQPDGDAGSISGVDDDGVIELELVHPEDEFDNAGRRLGLAGTVVSLLLHVWIVFNLSGLFLEPDDGAPYVPPIETTMNDPVDIEEPEETIDYELANPDERELEVREVINSTSVGVAQNDNPQPKAPPTPELERPPTELQQVAYDIPEGIEVDDRIVVKGTVGESIVQLESALDLVTWEIANNLKERKVMVVWMLDASAAWSAKGNWFTSD